MNIINEELSLDESDHDSDGSDEDQNCANRDKWLNDYK